MSIQSIEFIHEEKQDVLDADEEDKYHIIRSGLKSRIVYHEAWAAFHSRFVDRLWEICPKMFAHIKGPGMVVQAQRLFQPVGAYPYIISDTEYPCIPLFAEAVEMIDHVEAVFGGQINSMLIDYYISPRNSYKKNSKRVRLHTPDDPYVFVSIGESQMCRRMQVRGPAKSDVLVEFPLLAGSMVAFLNGAYYEFNEAIPEEKDDVMFEDSRLLVFHFFNYTPVAKYQDEFQRQRDNPVSIFDDSFTPTDGA